MPAKNQVAVVTGAGSGIGRACSIGLLEAGWNVVLAGRRQSSLEETVVLAKAKKSQAICIPTDVTEPDDVKNLFEETVDQFERVDLLFNNAGISLPSTYVEVMDFDDWKRMVDVNLTGAFLCTQQAVRAMKSQIPRGGRIINNGSVSAHVPRPHSIAYTATKHAITGLTKSTALDGRNFDICCGQIDIGNAATDMTDRMSKGVPQADGSIAPEPTIHVQRVVDAVLYMASLPLGANVPFITVMATGMPMMGRG